MGMGLILGGIGKGIADAGAAYGGGMSKMAEFEMQQEREAQREQRQLRLADQLETQKEEKRARQAIEVEQRASEAPLKREAGDVVTAGSKVAGDSPVATKEEVLKLIKENPQYREVYRKAGILTEDKMDPRLRQAVDQESAAREVGVSSTMLDSYRKAKTDTLALIKQEQKEKSDETKSDQRDRQLDIMEKGIVARQAAAAGGSTPKVRSSFEGKDGKMVMIMSDGTTKTTDLTSGKFEKRVTDQINLMSKNDYAFKQLSVEEQRAKAMELVSSQSAKPSDNAIPAPAKPSADAGASSAPKAGDTKIVASGPNAGKTAVFDGTGWKLK